MTDPLILIGCGGAKRDGPEPAYALYDSSYFEKKMSFGILGGQPAIASAKHGFVWPGEKLDYYDETLTEATDRERELWAMDMESAIPDRYGHVVILAGKAYREYLVPLLESQRRTMVHSPFDYTHGIGEQQAFLDEGIERFREGGGTLPFLQEWRGRHEVNDG